MICKTCGKELNNYDRFCSNCGTLVEFVQQTQPVQPQQPAMPQQPQNFEWNVHSFPTEPVKPTQDTSFDWGIQEGEFRRRPEVQQPDAVEGFSPDDPMFKFQQQAQQPEVAAQPEQPKQKSGFFARFTKDKGHTIENPAITEELIQQAAQEQQQTQPEQIQNNIENRLQQAIEQPPVNQQPEPEIKVKHVDFDWDQPVVSGNIPAPVFATGGGENELKEEHEGDITGEELERELFGGAAVTGIVDGGEGLSKQTAKIDKFYTINRKNEEFQKLIDDEYEKFRSGKPLDDSTFAANVEAIKERTTVGMDRQTSVYDSMSEQLYAAQPEVQPTTGVVQDAKEEKPKKEKFNFGFLKKEKNPEEEALKEKKKAEKIAKKEAQKQESQQVAPAGQQPEEQTNSSEKQGLVGKIIIIVLSVILALLLIALGLKLIAPDSILSQKIDNVADGVMTIFTGNEEEPEAEAEDPNRDTFNGDLNGVIQTAVNDNYKEYISTITYDSGLAYEKKTKNIKIKIS